MQHYIYQTDSDVLDFFRFYELCHFVSTLKHGKLMFLIGLCLCFIWL